MSEDNRYLAMLGINFPFASDDAAAQLANTRTWIFGTDDAGTAAEVMSSWPGRVNTEAIQTLRETRAYDAGEAVPPDPNETKAAVTYDCATGKCSDGSNPRTSGFLGFLDPYLACATGNRTIINKLCSDGQGSLANDPFSKAYEDEVRQPAQAALERWGDVYLKRVAFVVLAIVLIYAGVRSL